MTPPLTAAVPVVNNAGDIVFWGKTSAGQGIFLFSDSVTTEIALTGQPAPGTGAGTFSTFIAFGTWPTVPVISDNGQVSFWAGVAGGTASQGIFLYSERALHKVALTGEGTPIDGTYAYFAQVPSLNNSGEVTFWAGVSGIAAPACPGYANPCAVFKVSDGTISKVIASGDTGPPGVGGTISRPGTVALMNDSGQVTFWAAISGGFSSQAIVRSTNGVMETVAAVGNPTPMTPTGGTFSHFMAVPALSLPTVPAPNDLGQVAFWGAVSGGSGTEGIFATELPAGPVVETVTTSGGGAPGGGTFDPSFDLDINDDGAAVFGNTLSGGTSSGIFRFFSGSPGEEVVRQGWNAPLDVGGQFSGFGPPVSSNSYVVARALANSHDGIFRFFSGSAETLATTLTGNPRNLAPGPGPARFFTGFADVNINDLDHVVAATTVALEGGGDPKPALYRFFAGSPGDPPDLLALGGDEASGFPPLTRFFAGFALPAISDGEVVVARATLDDDSQALYRFFAGLPVGSAERLAYQGGAAPDTALTFTAFGDHPAISPDGKVAYKASLSDGTDALFIYYPDSDTTKLLAKEGPAPPEIGGTYTGFANPVINRYGQVVARTMITNGSEVEGMLVFIKEEPGSSVDTKKIVVEGDPTPDGAANYGNDTPGDTVFTFYAYSDTARVVYVANLLGGSQNVYIASLDNDQPNPDGVLDFMDNCPTVMNTDQNNTDKALAVTNPLVVGDDLGNSCDTDIDGDGYLNAVDACATTPTIWPTPPGDSDCDGFTDARETFLTTDPGHACAANNGAGNEGPPDRWPFDFDDNQRAALADVLGYISVFNSTYPNPPYNQRFDLDQSGGIRLADVLSFIPVFNKLCTP